MSRYIAAVMATSLLIGFHWAVFPHAFDAVSVVYWLIGAMCVVQLVAAGHVTDRQGWGIPAGRVVAVVPSYNEDRGALVKCVRALLDSSVLIDRVYVVDDGSDDPVGVPFTDPRVAWIRQPNMGKRYAQRAALDVEEPNAPRFIVTVDSDSVVEPRAVEHCLRALFDPSVQAATGMHVVTRYDGSLLGRLFDLELVTWCKVGRAARSRFGAVAPCSGILSVYRSCNVFPHLDDYVSSGNCGDDRRLTHYALLKGRVEGVNEAVVHSEMPSQLRPAFRQRVRWFQSYWRYVPWELERLSGPVLWWRVWNLILILLTPVMLVWAFVLVPVAGHGAVFWPVVAFWLGMNYAQTLRYALERPGMGAVERWTTWLFLTPLLIPWQMFVVRPAMWKGLATARSGGWHGRG